MRNHYFQFRKSLQSRRSKRSTSYKIGRKNTIQSLIFFFLKSLKKWYWICTFPICKQCALKFRLKNHLLTSLYVKFLLWRPFRLLLSKWFISVQRVSGYCFCLYCLLANVIGTFQKNLGQPYVRLTSKSKITRKEAMLSWHLLRDSVYLNCHKGCILLFTGKCDRYFSKESWTTLRPFDVKI